MHKKCIGDIRVRLDVTNRLCRGGFYMADDRTVDALIFAGGVGRRMGAGSRPKQFLELGGKPIIAYTLDHFEQCERVTGITVACLPDWIDYLEEIVRRQGYRTPITIVPGGKTGFESRLNALEEIHSHHPEDEGAIVLVHDGVRPLINAETISDCIDATIEHHCVATTAPCVETVIVQDEDGKVVKVEDRSRCFLARAPQGFFTNELYRAHLRARDEKRDFVDSVSLMSYYGYDVFTVLGPAENIKVTTPTDYFAFKSFVDERDMRMLWEGRK